VPVYVVSRPRAWLSEEELAATLECAPAILEQFAEHIRWIRSDVFQEDDGSFSGQCVYEATSPEWIERLSEAAMLPVASIKELAVTYAAA
jgi:hypothetical protein